MKVKIFHSIHRLKCLIAFNKDKKEQFGGYCVLKMVVEIVELEYLPNSWHVRKITTDWLMVIGFS